MQMSPFVSRVRHYYTDGATCMQRSCLVYYTDVSIIVVEFTIQIPKIM
jgi:hypothetical protein